MSAFSGLWSRLGFQPVILWSDALIYVAVLCVGVWFVYAIRSESWRVVCRRVTLNRTALFSLGVLGLYVAVGLLDTFHFRPYAAHGAGLGGIRSVLDTVCAPLVAHTEKTYSAPFATHLYLKETVWTDTGLQERIYPPLEHVSQDAASPRERVVEIGRRSIAGLVWGLGIGLSCLLVCWWRGWSRRVGRYCVVAGAVIGVVVVLSSHYHLLGTDKTGQDVFYAALKGIRTGLVIGLLTTFLIAPLAIAGGVPAGYFGGWIDDLIQYVYTTLASIPDILLIAAAMLIFEVGLSDQETVVSADQRLVYLCIILGVTSWTGLCRLIRAEVLKLRELEYVQAAVAFGVSHVRIMVRHLVPNVLHLVLISLVLRFSGLVLAEAVLAYVGIGVDPSMHSWGNMINQARLELARAPIVWWNLLAAFVFMLGLVLPANVVGDAIRDALDPRLRTR